MAIVGVEVAAKNDAAAQYDAKITVFVVFSCIAAGMGGLIIGYDVGVSGGVTSMDAFLSKFFPEVYRRMREARVSNYCKFDSQLLTAFTSSLYFAGLVSTFFASRITTSLGRRRSMLSGGVIFLLGSALAGAAVNVSMVILGRVLLGVGLGFSTQSVPVYLSEMAPPRNRGAFTNGFQFLLCIGAISAGLVNYGTEKLRGGWGWRLSLALAAVPAAFLSLAALFLPETPNSLIQQGEDPQKVAALLRKVRGVDDVSRELGDLVAARDDALPSAASDPFRTIIQRNYRPQLAMAILIPFFQQMTGINIVGFYAPVLFRSLGINESASLLSTVMLGLVSSASTFMSMLTVDRFGRRNLLIIGGILMFVPMVMIGAVMAAKLGDEGEVTKGYAYLLIVLIAVYAIGFSWSWGPLGWLIPSEVFPLEIRSAGQSITVAVNFLLTAAVAQTFLAMLCHMKYGIFFFFAGWLAAMTLFVLWFLPETRGLPMEHISELWKEHWFWKRFLSHR